MSKDIRLKTLLDKYTNEEILRRVKHLYRDKGTIKSLPGYMRALRELRRMEPKLVRIRVLVEEVEDFEDKKKKYIRVNGKKDNDETRWAIEYTPWVEWLGMRVAPESLTNFGELNTLAHCLWEMTWSGFSSKAIKKRWEEILSRVKEAKKEIAKHEHRD